MKKLFTIAAILFTLSASAQKDSLQIITLKPMVAPFMDDLVWHGVGGFSVDYRDYPQTIIENESDTLIVPEGKYHYIKIGDKVYKLVTTLEEVKPEQQGLIFNGGTYTPYYPNLNGLNSDSTIFLGYDSIKPLKVVGE